MFWSKRKIQNRRLGRVQVLDVKVRSSRVRAVRARFAGVALAVTFGTLFGLLLLWRAGEWGLRRLVYENKSFAIQQIDVQTDGVISPDQLRRWSGVNAGENLFALDLVRVKRDLELIPVIQSVAVERVLPGMVRIRVTEREPIAQINVTRVRPTGGIEVVVFQIDAQGCVMLPLDPRQRAVPLSESDSPLPIIRGVNVTDLQPGRKVELPQTQAALQLIISFAFSPMSGLVDLKSIDVSSKDVLTVTTGQGSEITFAPDDVDQQLLRWWTVHQECRRLNRTIATLDLAVSDYTPLSLAQAAAVPPPARKIVKPPRPSRRRNV